jgi:nitroreductase
MDAIEALMTRRSIRSYTDQPVSDEALDKILRAAMAAPSAGNERPWHFVVVRDRGQLETVASGLRYGTMTRQASLAVVVCGELDLERHPGFWVLDCSAATENLLLAAHALGLGAVWLGIYPVEERVEFMRSVCEIPARVTPFAVVAIGHPEEYPGPVDRFDKSRIHIDRW